jgi:hypothetical protein
MSDAVNTNNDHGHDLAGKKKTFTFVLGFQNFSNTYTMLVIMTHGKKKAMFNKNICM